MKYQHIVKIEFLFGLIFLVTDALVSKTKRTTLEYERAKTNIALKNMENVKEYSNKFSMKYVGLELHAKKLGDKFGYQFVKKIANDTYEFKKEDLKQCSKSRHLTHIHLQTMLNKDKSLKTFEQELCLKLSKYETMATEYNITDAWWPKQWHLHPNHTPSMQVHEAWMEGYTGSGMTLAFVDDGVDTSHTDLVENFDFSLSHNYPYGIANGSHLYEEGHGTMTSGIAMAAKNSECIVGISHKAKFTAIKLLDENRATTTSDIAASFTHRLDVIDISSNSWGNVGYGVGFFPHSTSVTAAIERGIKEGRQGRGVIYVMATGNDGQLRDDCNAEGNVVSIYTIAVNSLIADGNLAVYGETCTSVLISAYGGAQETVNNTGKITTTSRDSECTDDFAGTSAACPVVSGIIALALEANSNLTWRDIQHLIVKTATTDALSEDLNFVVNGAGKKVSEKAGFGLINALGMVQAAKTWKTVPTQIKCVKERPNMYACCSGPLIEIIQVEDCNIGHLEHVEVHINFKAVWREYVELHLISPFGTDSKLLRQRVFDMTSQPVDHTFMSVHHWGEDPAGNWTLQLDNFFQCHNEMKIYSYTVTWYGTITDIEDGQPPDGTFGGYCDHMTTCTNGTTCRMQLNTCVFCDLLDERVVNDTCMKEGDVGGYCDVNTTCTLESSVCNYNNNTCLLCEDGFRNIDGVCMEDGLLGGYCHITEAICSEEGVGCYEYRCIQCSNGFHLYGAYCIEDGTLYGYCDEELLCAAGPRISCLVEENVCVECLYWTNYSDLYGLCIQDGILGGYCSIFTHCTDPGNGCDRNTSRCVYCANDGVHVIQGYCWQDAVLFGYCNTTMPCIDDSVCDLDINECVECDESDYRSMNGFCFKDGILGGYCDEDTRCTQPNSACLQNETMCVYCTDPYIIQNGSCVLNSDADNDGTDADTTKPAIVGTVAFVSAVAVSGMVMFIVFKKFLAQKLSMNILKSSPNGCSNGIVAERQVDAEIGKERFTNKRNGTANTNKCTNDVNHESENGDPSCTTNGVLSVTDT